MEAISDKVILTIAILVLVFIWNQLVIGNLVKASAYFMRASKSLKSSGIAHFFNDKTSVIITGLKMFYWLGAVAMIVGLWLM